MLVYQLAFKLCCSFSDPHASPERISPRVGQAPTPPCTASDYSCPSTLKFHLEMEDLSKQNLQHIENWFSSLTLHRRARASLTSCILSRWRLSWYKGLKTYWSSSWLHCLVIYLIRNICREENSDKQYYIINKLLYEVAMGCLCHAPHGTGCMRTCSIHSLYEKDLLYVGWVNIYMMCRLCLICQWSIDGKASTNGGKGLCWLTYDRVAHVQEDNLCNQNLKYLLVSTHQLTLYVDRALEALHNLSTALTCCMHRPL